MRLQESLPFVAEIFVAVSPPSLQDVFKLEPLLFVFEPEEESHDRNLDIRFDPTAMQDSSREVEAELRFQTLDGHILDTLRASAFCGPTVDVSLLGSSKIWCQPGHEAVIYCTITNKSRNNVPVCRDYW